MDKLRALDYFLACVETGSFSAAARRFDVSVTAVAKLLSALERSLGTRLFERSAQGLALTASGAAYAQACRPALTQLEEAEERVRASARRPSGTVVAAVQQVIAAECLAPVLPEFRARHPDIHVDLRDFAGVGLRQGAGVDVFVTLGWLKLGRMIHRQVGAADLVVCASPGYWRAHGMPERPKDLERHNCLLMRGHDGTVLDLWSFARAGVEESVTVRGWLLSSNTQRDVAVKVALAGDGVVRLIDLANRPELESGALMPALRDWQALDAPPVNLVYRPSVRRVPRVRAFIDFVVEIFGRLAARRGERTVAAPMPAWRARVYGRASTSLRRRRPA